MISLFISITLGITGFLFLLNAIFVFVFRKGGFPETLSYILACLVELAIFALALALRLNILTSVPYHLPPNLPFNRAEIGAALAVAIGLFPVAVWHRNSASLLRARIDEDTKAIKEHKSGVYIRSNNGPGEWMN